MRRKTRSLAQTSTKWDLNAHNPVSRLPAEILSLIFLLVRIAHESENPRLTPGEKPKRRLNPFDPETEDAEYDVEDDDMGWIGVSHVCHSWRQIALGSSLLWAHIIIEDKKCLWAMEMLKRSKGHLLAIYIDLDVLGKASGHKLTPAAVARSALTSATKNFDRCKELFIKVGISNKSLKALHSILEKCFNPSLASLSIVDCVHGYSRFPKISDNFIKTDSLRTLNLACADVELGASFLRGLTTLSLNPWDGLGGAEFGVLLDGLASMPSLTSLDIDMDDVDISPADVTLFKSHRLRERPMQLNHLSISCFRSPLPATSLLSFTAKKPIQLYLSVSSMTEKELDDLTAFFDEFNSRIGRPITGYCLTHARRGNVVIEGYHTIKQRVFSCGRDQDALAFSIELSCMFDIFETKDSALIDYAFTKLPTEDLRGFVLSGDYPYRPRIWNFVGRLKTVEYICLCGGLTWTEGFHKLLEDKEVFPSLVAIGTTVAPGASGKVKTDSLSRSLRSRLQNGKKIQHLLLHGVPEGDRDNFGGIRDFVGLLEITK